MFPADLPAPLIIAHRGASAEAPENTIAAFQRALEIGSQAIEFDVKLSADGAVVIMHDATVDRTSDGHGSVHRMTLAQLRALDAGSWYDHAFQGERIPTLDEVFSLFGSRLFMNVELTNYSSPFDNLVPKVALLVKKHKLQGRVLFSSFYPHNLSSARRLLPEVPRGQLALGGWHGDWQRLIGRLMDIQSEHPFAGDLNPRYVDAIHARKRRAYTYTVNEAADMRRFLDMGVDGFFTDNPALALSIRAGQAS